MNPSTSNNTRPKKALGIVVPFDMELDRELWRWAPENVDLLVTRTPATDPRVTIEFAKSITDPEDMKRAVASIISGRASVVAYGCTSASFVNGAAGEEAIRKNILAAGVSDAVTTSGAIVLALKSLRVKRVSVVTPYLEDLSALLDGFLAEHGITSLANESMGVCEEIWQISAAKITEMILKADRSDSEAVVVSCTNLPTYDLIASLEKQIQKPIVTANQATMWAALKAIGEEANGKGQMLIESDHI